jgi:hypothetical protein
MIDLDLNLTGTQLAAVSEIPLAVPKSIAEAHAAFRGVRKAVAEILAHGSPRSRTSPSSNSDSSH